MNGGCGTPSCVPLRVQRQPDATVAARHRPPCAEPRPTSCFGTRARHAHRRDLVACASPGVRRSAPPLRAARRRRGRRPTRTCRRPRGVVAGRARARRRPARPSSSPASARDRAASRSRSRCSTAARASRCCAGASGCSTSTTRARSSALGRDRRRDRAGRAGDRRRATALRHRRRWATRCWSSTCAPLRADPPRPS